jgi:hypothetical protein
MALEFYRKFLEVATPEDDCSIKVANERIHRLGQQAALLN